MKQTTVQFVLRAGLALVLILTLVLYWPGFGGFWLGDDLSNLHGAHHWALDGEWTTLLKQQFFDGVGGGGAFFRPLIIISLYLNYLFAGAVFGGWFGINLAVHLANSALIAALVVRIAALQGAHRAAPWAALLAASFFSLNPFIAEAVFWVSARSDGWVTLLSLLALFAWIGQSDTPNRLTPWLMPALLIPALLFKESAAFLPFALILLWAALPSLRTWARSLSLTSAFVFVGAFMAWRATLFGDPWEVYLHPENGHHPLISERLLHATQSLPHWLEGLFGPQFPLALAQLLFFVATVLLAFFAAGHRRAGLALLTSAAGLILLTFANLGPLATSGEGGRLFYTPMAFAALGAGVLLSSLWETPQRHALRASAKILGLVTLVMNLTLLHPRLDHVWGVQAHLHGIVSAIPAAVDVSEHQMIVLVPDHVGPVVAARNGQGAIVSPPLQERSLLKQALPTIPYELELRFAHYHQRDLDRHTQIPKVSSQPWPDRIACWSPSAKALVIFAAPAPINAGSWSAQILADAQTNHCLL